MSACFLKKCVALLMAMCLLMHTKAQASVALEHIDLAYQLCVCLLLPRCEDMIKGCILGFCLTCVDVFCPYQDLA